MNIYKIIIGNCNHDIVNQFKSEMIKNFNLIDENKYNNIIMLHTNFYEFLYEVNDFEHMQQIIDKYINCENTYGAMIKIEETNVSKMIDEIYEIAINTGKDMQETKKIIEGILHMPSAQKLKLYMSRFVADNEDDQ